MCEAPHTYLTENITAVGISGRGQQTDRNGDRSEKRQNILKKIDTTNLQKEAEKETTRVEE